jgi:hypothetical protein
MSWVDVLKKTYPFLTIGASFIPGGNIATSVLGKILNLKDGSTIDDAGQALVNATPEQRAALLAEENRHSEAMNSMGITSAVEYERLMLADRADARAMQVQTRSLMPPILAAAAVLTMIFCLWMVGFRTLPETGHDAVILLLGVVVGTVKDVYGYVFGSSAGSASKTDALTAIAQQKP